MQQISYFLCISLPLKLDNFCIFVQASRSQGHGKNVCGDRTTLLQYTLMRRQRKMHILHKQLQGILTRVKFMVQFLLIVSVQSSSTRYGWYQARFTLKIK